MIFKKDTKEKGEKKPAASPKPEARPKKDPKPKADSKPKTETKPVREAREIRHWIKRPWISEKSTDLREKETYVFLVHDKAGKQEIAKEVEARYGVRVEGVRVVRKEGKTKRFGKSTAKRGSIKKAMVKLKKGDSIEII